MLKFYSENGYSIDNLKALKALETTIKAISISQVKRLAGKGNAISIAILEGKRSEVLEDLQSATKLYLLERIQDGSVYFSDLLRFEDERAESKKAKRLMFEDSEVFLGAFSLIDEVLYGERKHERKSAGSLDNTEYTKQFAGNDDIEFEAIKSDFLEWLSDSQKDILSGLIAGYTQAEMIKIYGYSNGMIARLKKQVQNMWKKYNAIQD